MFPAYSGSATTKPLFPIIDNSNKEPENHSKFYFLNFIFEIKKQIFQVEWLKNESFKTALDIKQEIVQSCSDSDASSSSSIIIEEHGPKIIECIVLSSATTSTDSETESTKKKKKRSKKKEHKKHRR